MSNRKVAVEKWTMSNHGNYRPSSGYATVYIVPEDFSNELAAASAAGTNSLFDFVTSGSFREVRDDEIQEMEPCERRNGVLDYVGVTGVLIVEDGFYPIQVSEENICTRDDVIRHARPLDASSMLGLYNERVNMYQKAAESAAENLI